MSKQRVNLMKSKNRMLSFSNRKTFARDTARELSGERAVLRARQQEETRRRAAELARASLASKERAGD